MDPDPKPIDQDEETKDDHKPIKSLGKNFGVKESKAKAIKLLTESEKIMRNSEKNYDKINSEW